MGDSEALEQVWAVALAGEPHVPGHIEMREQAVVLREVTHAAPLRAETHVLPGIEPHLAGERDASRVRTLQPGDRSQQRRLARARGADEYDGLAADVQRCAKIERPPSESDVNFEEVCHERASILEVSRIAALTTMSRTPIATA